MTKDTNSTKLDFISKEISEIKESSKWTKISVNKMQVQAATMEEHLKGINGKIISHEISIGQIASQQVKDGKTIAKFIGAGVIVGSVGTLIFELIFNVL